MMASSGSRTVHSRPIGSVHVGSSKEIIMSDLSLTMEMAVILRLVRIEWWGIASNLYSQDPHTEDKEKSKLLARRHLQLQDARHG